MTFYRCPECTKKGVYKRLGREDCWVCRYCGWSIFDDDHSRLDRVGMTAMAAANGDSFFWWRSTDWFPYEEET